MSKDVESLFDRIGQTDLKYRVFDNLPLEDGGVATLRPQQPERIAPSGRGLLRAYAPKAPQPQPPAPAGKTSLAKLFSALARKAADAA